MMVPDYALIAEIKLYSFGFSDARNMARKLVQVLRLCSEQLSSQKHYDYGMRAVFSILVRAGNLRQQLGDQWTEDLIVLSAITDVNMPKFTTNDLPLFRGITQDLFPGAVLPEPDYKALESAILQTCKDRNLQPKDTFLKSVIQLRETVAVRHGLMVVGETCCGKTKVINTLAEAFGRVKGAGSDYGKVQVHTINPKSVKQNQLYGRTDPNTQEWTDGMLAVIYRNCSTDDSKTRHWIVFDGPVDAVWIEDMNTVLDDNKKLCLTSGEIIKMSNRMTMMFETDNLREASPATVSRVGMVFMEPKRTGWRPAMQSWLLTLDAPHFDQRDREQLASLCDWLVPPVLHFIARGGEVLCPVTPIEQLQSVLTMLDALLTEAVRECAAPVPEKEKPRLLESLLIMSIVWSIGSATALSARQPFDEYLRALLLGKPNEHPIFLDFMAKNPKYDGHFSEGGLCLRAYEGDVRDYDTDPYAAAKGSDGEGAGAGESKEGEDEDEEARRRKTKGRFDADPVRDGEARKTISPIPEDRTLFDFCVDLAKGGWNDWMQGVPTYSVPEGATFNSIIVPTIDTIRNEWIIDLLIRSHNHVLCVGDTGTGKSVSL